MRPPTDRLSSPTPVKTMFTAMTRAMIGSRIFHSGMTMITASPATSPTEVQTSVSRCRASASKVMESKRSAARSMIRAVRKLMTEETSARTRPKPKWSSGCGARNRCRAAQAMPMAATMISTPSMPLEEILGLAVPVGVVGIRRTQGDGDGGQGEDARREVDQGLGGVGEQSDRVGHAHAPNLSTRVRMEAPME